MFKNRRLKQYIKMKYNLQVKSWRRKFYFILNENHKHMAFKNLEDVVKYLEEKQNEN